MAKASSIPGASWAKFLTSVTPPLPFSPAARKVSSGSPACGTSFISIPRCVPTSTTSLSPPRDSHSLAIAIAGKTWPPVPPPAISNFIAAIRLRVAGSSRGRLLRNIQQHTCGQQHYQQTRTAIADKRQRNSLGGNHAQHHRKINQRLKNDHGGNSESQETTESIGSGECCSNSPPSVNREKCDHDHGPDKAQLFANHRVNEIGMRFGKIEKFLLAFHQADTGETAGADGNERLQQLKPGALRITVWIEKGHQARLTIGDVSDQQIKSWQRRCGASSNPLPGKSGDIQNSSGDQNDVHRSSEIGLNEDEADANQNWSHGREDVMQEISFAELHGGRVTAFEIEEPSEIKNDGQLRDFRWLNADRPEANPTMGGVRLIQEKCTNQHQAHGAHYAVNDDRLAELAVVGAHQHKHSRQAQRQPSGLTQQKKVGMSVLVLGGDRGCAENHDRAKQAQSKRCAKQPLVIFQTSRHSSSPCFLIASKFLLLLVRHDAATGGQVL